MALLIGIGLLGCIQHQVVAMQVNRATRPGLQPAAPQAAPALRRTAAGLVR